MIDLLEKDVQNNILISDYIQEKLAHLIQIFVEKYPKFENIGIYLHFISVQN